MTAQPFRYWRDPCCVVGLVLYVTGRAAGLLSLTPEGWWRGHAIDVLFVPVGLPLWLWLERRLGWRTHDRMPAISEGLFVLTVWTVAAEVAAPRLVPTATGDPLDAVAYATGALVAFAVWRT